MMARSSDAPSMGRIQKRKTNLSKSSLSACNARPVHTDGPNSDFSRRSTYVVRFCHFAEMFLLFAALRTSVRQGWSSDGLLSRLWNRATKDGTNNAGKRNHRQHGDKPPERECNCSPGNADAAAEKSAGIDNAGALSRLRRRKS